MSRRSAYLRRLHIVAVALLLVQAVLPMGHHVWCHAGGHACQVV